MMEQKNIGLEYDHFINRPQDPLRPSGGLIVGATTHRGYDHHTQTNLHCIVLLVDELGNSRDCTAT